MDSENFPKTLVESVAERLHADMHRRDLRPGDRYMTAAEASEWLSTSPVTVNRAMQILAERNLLVRRRSRGTYVGPEFQPRGKEPRPVDVLHVLMAMDYHDAHTTDSDQLVDAIQLALPGVPVEIHYIPDAESLHSTQRVVNRLLESETAEGVVLIRGTRPAQKLIQEADLAAVVYGQVFPGVSLNCLRHDQEAVGRLMAEYALERGHRKFALLAHSRWTHGDNLMVAGLTKRLSAAGIALDELRIHSVLPDPAVLKATVEDCQTEGDAPTIFFCRSDSYAAGLCEILRDSKLSSAEVISGGHGLPDEPQPFVRVVSEWSLERQMKKMVELIVNQIDDSNAGEKKSYQHVMVPVRLKVMDDNASPKQTRDRP